MENKCICATLCFANPGDLKKLEMKEHHPKCPMAKHTYLKITWQGSSCTYKFRDGIEEIKMFIEQGDAGDQWSCELVEMTAFEFKNMPEFSGW